jgi:hypothetical protein
MGLFSRFCVWALRNLALQRPGGADVGMMSSPEAALQSGGASIIKVPGLQPADFAIRRQ